MRLGLLLCDHVDPELLSISGDYDEMFRALFSAHSQIEIVVYDSINAEMPGDPRDCDAWMTSGSRHSVNDEDTWIRDLESFVRKVAFAGVPFVGICFGHQLLAKALGGRVEVAQQGWGVGVKAVQVNPEMGIDSYQIFNSHTEQVVALPSQAEVVGWNDHCPASMMIVKGRLLGIQGHPEMDLGFGEGLLNIRRGNPIPVVVADAALATLKEGSDSSVLADLIVEFIDTKRA